ncbi:MAG: hypothetical protein HRT68_14770 [Flavobacteriaceae bacterium]|nr:hypothetical protein [Flavobacteriaceae bacterium]
MTTHNINSNHDLNDLFTLNKLKSGDEINLNLLSPHVISLKVESLDFADLTSQPKKADVILLKDAKGHFGTIQKDGSDVINIFKTADRSPTVLYEYRA